MTKPTLSWTSKLAIQMTRSPPCMHGNYMPTQSLWKDLRPTLLSYHQFQKWDCSTSPRTNVGGLTLQGRYMDRTAGFVTEQSGTTSQPKTAMLPTCPQCQAPMRRRTGKRGEFWGCSNFPNCRGTR